MKNLILGSSGFVGRSLCNYLKNLGEQVIEYDIVNDLNQDCRYEKLPLNGIDRVYFLGWKVGGSNYLYSPETQKEQLDWNIKILTNCMDQLIDIPFVFVSSQLAESTDTIYGVLKKMGELWTGLNAGRSVRLWNVFGGFEKSSIKSHVVADFVHQALKTGVIKMMTDGSEKRQFIYIDDVCNSLHKSFDYKGTYDASSLEWNSVYEVAELISKYTGCKIMTGNKIGSSFFIPNKPVICKVTVSLDDGIKKTVELFKAK